MWEYKETITGIKIAHVGDADGLTVVVGGPSRLYDLMDSWFFDDVLSTGEPTSRGFYVCDVEVWFQQGYFEGYKHDGESEIEFRLVNVGAVHVPYPVDSAGRYVHDADTVSHVRQKGEVT